MVADDVIEVLKGKKVLLTGDTGFKGAWLSLWLNEVGAHVLGYALPPENDDDLFELLGLKHVIRHIDGDIRDADSLYNAFDEFQPEIVFHLAAQSLVRKSYDEPKETFDTNVAGSVNVLEAVRKTKSVRAMIYVTSDKCYRNKEWLWGYRENDELGGHDPYSASKAAAEVVFSSYMDSYLKVRESFGGASVRAGNVIGGGDWATDRIIPDAVRSLMVKEPLFLRNPMATRPWQHVLDPLYAYMLLAARLYEEPEKHAGSWNFGPTGDAVRSVKDLADKILGCWGEGAIEIAPQTNAPHEAGMLQLNCDKARQMLMWKPRWGFERSVAETIRWYKEVMVEKKEALQVSRGQIKEFMGGLEDD